MSETPEETPAAPDQDPESQPGWDYDKMMEDLADREAEDVTHSQITDMLMRGTVRA